MDYFLTNYLEYSNATWWKATTEGFSWITIKKLADQLHFYLFKYEEKCEEWCA